MNTNRPRIERLELAGFKSIRSMTLEFRPLNVLVGANGAGKSNLVSYFSLLRESLALNLDDHVGRYGGSNAFLHLGAKHTSEIVGAVTMQTAAGSGTLYQRLGFRAPDSLFYSGNHAGRLAGEDRSDEMGFDGTCSVIKRSGPHHPQQLIYVSLKDKIGGFHFHDTSLTAAIRSAGYIEDNRALRVDAGNLAAILFRMQQSDKVAYRRIVATIRTVAPFFDDFSLAPRSLTPLNILLNWRQIGSDYEFGPHQLSDGTLRAMALITLLFQPESDLPDLIIVDEPELGLHPHALSVVASLLKRAANYTQVLITTQSSSLLDFFEPQDVVVTERTGNETTFRRLNSSDLETWLDEYSLGEVWEKNVVGGGPL